MDSLGHKLHDVAKTVSECLNRKTLPVVKGADTHSFSIFEDVPVSLRSELIKIAMQHPECARAIGSMVGMAVCDSVGHAFEFLPVAEPGSHFNRETLEVTGDYNATNHIPSSGGLGKFKLKEGQWTDDTSMGLCNADSLLVCEAYDGCDIRVRFWNWWNCGYNNAFRFDRSRSKSVGLGGNIALSLEDINDRLKQNLPLTPRFEAQGQDAGNGSLMRLTPIPLYFHADLKMAIAHSRESSYTTHPGPIAAEACAFVGYVVVRAVKRANVESSRASVFLDQCVKEYLARSKEPVQPELLRLLRAKESEASTELCWNWREFDYAKLLRKTLVLRGKQYNGYPVSAGYFGSYSMDGLAMALNAFYHTSSFMEALSRIVNFRGDSDSTGSICGQIAGAFYGIDSIDRRLVSQLQNWDNGEIALRGALLYALGEKLPAKSNSKRGLVDAAQVPKSKPLKKRPAAKKDLKQIAAKHLEKYLGSLDHQPPTYLLDVKGRPSSDDVLPIEMPASSEVVLKRPAINAKPKQRRPSHVVLKKPASKVVSLKHPKAMKVKRRRSSSNSLLKRPASKEAVRKSLVARRVKRKSSSNSILKRKASKEVALKRPSAMQVKPLSSSAMKKQMKQKKKKGVALKRPAAKQVKSRPSKSGKKGKLAEKVVLKRSAAKKMKRQSPTSGTKGKIAKKVVLKRPAAKQTKRPSSASIVRKRTITKQVALKRPAAIHNKHRSSSLKLKAVLPNRRSAADVKPRSTLPCVRGRPAAKGIVQKFLGVVQKFLANDVESLPSIRVETKPEAHRAAIAKHVKANHLKQRFISSAVLKRPAAASR